MCECADIERPSDVDVVLPGSTSRLHSGLQASQSSADSITRITLAYYYYPDMADFSSKSPDDDVGTVRLVGSAQPSEDELGG